MLIHHKARYPYLWCPTTEDERFIRENRLRFDMDERSRDVKFFTWDIVSGYREMIQHDNIWTWQKMQATANTPITALNAIEDIPENSVIFLKDFHRYFKEIVNIRKTLSLKDHLKGEAKTLVFLGPVGDGIPYEFGNDITRIEFKYPDREALFKILQFVVDSNAENGVKMPDNHSVIVDALMGMTAEGAENALTYSIVKTKGQFDVPILLAEKSKLLAATGYMNFGTFNETFDDLNGLQEMKDFVLSTILSPESKGILIYGTPGTGKSHFAKALANHLQWALIQFKISNLRSKWQGVAQERLVDALHWMEAFGRSIIFVDELDKAISGTESDTDGGTGARMVGELLTYWEDRKESGAYWVCTANNLEVIKNISGGALINRFDAVFFVDMPTPAEQRAIAKIWSDIKGVDIPLDCNLDGYVGRDIKKLATTMKMMKDSGKDPSAKEAQKYILAFGKAFPDKLAQIKKSAEGTCIPATRPAQEITPQKKRTANVLTLH